MIRQGQREALVRALASRPVLRTGMITGASLVIVMLASLFVANHIPQLEHVAWIRNNICRLAFGVVMLIPILRFLLQPRRLISSALIGWTIFSIAYGIAGTIYANLFTSLGRNPLEAFLLGMVTYGVIAVISWVAMLAFTWDHQPKKAAQQGAEGARQPR
ncbi:MAG TPA: hypothetical protein VJN21_02075 [Candidatus Acidoferrales bacterium]|nr:hypothetical protein [Candidatus Acidoferrales bacterium]